MYRQRGRTLRKKFHKQVALSFGNGLDVEQKNGKVEENEVRISQLIANSA